MKVTLKYLVSFVVVVAALVATSPPTAVAAPVARTTAVVPAVVPWGAPCTVYGYGGTVRARMIQWGISEQEVRNSVSASCQQGRVSLQWNGTFKYDANYLVVVMTPWGTAVGVYYNSGGSAGSWQGPSN